MANEYKWPVAEGGSGGGVQVVPTAAALPPAGTNGQLILVYDEDALYEWRDTQWVVFIDPSNVQDSIDAVQANVDQVALDLSDHEADLSNPHQVTKAQVGLGNVDNTSDANKPVSTAQQAALNLKQSLSEKGQPNGYASLGAGGKIPSSELPPVAITETFVVASQADQTALTAQVGDVAVRTDEDKSYILQSEPASIFSNWVLLRTPADAVLSVNGQTGAVSLDTDDIPEGTSQYFTVERAQDAAGALFISSTTINTAYDDGANLVYIDLIQDGVNRNQSGGGALTIANGGTGQTTKTNAFDALAPTSAKGDLIAYNGTDNVRVAAGVNGYALKANSATPEGVSYGPVAVYEGEKNYVPDPYSVGGTWVQGTSTITTTTTLAQLPEPSYGSAVALTGTGYSTIWPRQIDPVDLNKSLKLSFAALYAGAPTEFEIQIRSYATIGDRNADVNSFSSGNLLPVTIYQRGPNNLFSFTSDSNPWLNVRLVKSAATALYMSSVLVGPGQLQSVTPSGINLGTLSSVVTQGFGTVTVANVDYYRDGDRLRAVGSFTPNTATGAQAQLGLPFNLTAAKSRMGGRWWRATAGANTRKTGNMLFGPGVGFVYFASDDYATALPPTATLNGNQVAPANDIIYFEYEVEVQQWAGQQIAVGPGSTVEYAYNTNTGVASDLTSFGYGPQGAALPSTTASTVFTKRAQFSTPIQPTDKVTLEVSLGGSTFVELGSVLTGAAVVGLFSGLENQNGNYYGLGVIGINGPAGQVDLRFGTYSLATGATYASAGQNWNATTGNSRWRLKKEAAASAAGIQSVGPSNNGLQYPCTPETALTVTSGQAGWVTNYASGQAYSDANGVWRLRFIVRGSFTGATVTNVTATIAGVTFAAMGSQPCAALWDNTAALAAGRTQAGSGNIHVYGNASPLGFTISGDVILLAKPSWA